MGDMYSKGGGGWLLAAQSVPAPRIIEEGLDLEETVSRRVVNPGVVVGTPDAGLQVDGFSGNFFAGQLARVGYPTSGRSFDGALLPPGFEVLHLGDSPRVLNPLDNLSHRHEINVVVLLQYFVDPIKESV